MLTYCMNVHPGETLDEQIHNIEHLATDVARRYRIQRELPSDHPFGLGLRFGHAAASEFVASAVARSRLCHILEAHALVPFTMNAFPFGVFHGSTVKEEVYRPTWTDPHRIVYTEKAARSLALLMPKGTDRGSVSTAPLSYKTFNEDQDIAIKNVVKALKNIQELHEETGKYIILSMEPEPGCFPETTDETIDVILRIKEACGEALASYLGVCFDTAHLAIQFEELAESVRKFTAAGIAIGKCQLSAALEGDDTSEVRQALAKYAEGTYLHQTIRQRSNGDLDRFGDLPEALASPPCHGARFRTHFHVPLFENGNATLGTTAASLHEPAFIEALRENGCEQFEVETYTWDVWRQCTDSATAVLDGIVRELDLAAGICSGV